MNSPFANIFLAIQQQIATELPEVKFTEHDFGQLDDYTNGRPAVAFPCILIDFDAWVFENMGSNAQRAEGDVIIKFGYEMRGNSNNVTDNTWKEQALDYYETELKVYQKLEGFTPGEGFGYLTRTAETKENRPGYIRQKTYRFRLAFEDYSASPVLDTTPRPVPNITG